MRPTEQDTDPSIAPFLAWWLAVDAKRRAKLAEIEAAALVERIRQAMRRSDARAILALSEQVYAVAIRVQVLATAASAATRPRQSGAVWGWVGLIVGVAIGYLLRTP